MAGEHSACASFRLSVGADVDPDAADARLCRFLEAARQHEFAEIWVDRADYPALCALVHGDTAWLMCLRCEGDGGFSTRNPAYLGSADATLDFMLSNGQVDQYPASWTFPVEVVFEVLRAFARTGRVTEVVQWANDSGDGAEGPDAPFTAR